MSDTYYSSTQAIGKVKFNDNRHRPPPPDKGCPLHAHGDTAPRRPTHTLLLCHAKTHKDTQKNGKHFPKMEEEGVKKNKKNRGYRLRTPLPDWLSSAAGVTQRIMG